MTLGFQHTDGLSLLKDIDDKSVDLVLTDPPYIISKTTGMDKVFIDKQKGVVKAKYGTKYAIQTDYGEWDAKFTLEDLTKFVNEFYRVLKKGGTCIIFFDLWKIETLTSIMTEAGFSKIRMIEWVKTNPVPINSKVAYLNNAREIAIVGVKGSGQVFNSKYDKGIYEFPIYRAAFEGDRFHPTQKPIELFKVLIEKHSNPNQVVVDPFGGSGTTAIASLLAGRKWVSCEADKAFHEQAQRRIDVYVGQKKVSDPTFFESN